MINLYYPLPGHQTAEASCFVVGQVSTLSAGEQLVLKCSASPEVCTVSVSPSGYFSQCFPLNVGENRLELQVLDKKSQIIAETSQHLYRMGPRVPDKPELLLQPGPYWLQPEESLSIVVLSPPNHSPVIRIPEWEQTVALFPASTIDTRSPVFAALHQNEPPLLEGCVYTGMIHCPTETEFPDHSTLFLDDQPTSWVLTRLSEPSFGDIQVSRAIIRTAPDWGARLTPLPQGARIQMTGRQGEWVRFQREPSSPGWIHQADVRLLSDAERRATLTLPYGECTALQLVDIRPIEPDEAELRLQLTTPVPYQIDTHPEKLTVRLFQTLHACDFIHWRGLPKPFCPPHSNQKARLFCLQIACPRFSGIESRYDGNTLVLRVRTLPKRVEACRILIDPGHGGDELGSHGPPNGEAEKGWNLRLAQQLEKTLDHAGFQVKLTRTTDCTVSLKERAEAFVQQYRPHVVLSLHHNALPDGRDPAQAEGISTYYYTNQSQPLALALLQQLAKQSQRPAYGLLYDSLAMTRIPEAISVLIEFGFFTHPNDVEAMQTQRFQTQACEAILAVLQQLSLSDSASDLLRRSRMEGLRQNVPVL